MSPPLARLRKLAKYSFPVPWCVPQWGWREFRATLTGSVPFPRDTPIAFAAEAAARVGCRYGVPAGRGRVAVELGLGALGVGAGDDVVLPSYVCDELRQAVGHLGARAVFADIGPALNVTLETVLAALTPATRCVIVPHLFGAPAPIDAIEAALGERGIALMDDAAQALGASVGGRPVGSFGACGIVSCGIGKPIAGSGGGALVSNDGSLCERAIALAPRAAWKAARRRVAGFWFWQRFRRVTLPARKVLIRLRPSLEAVETDFSMAGLSELEAAIAMVQLDRLADTIAERRKHAAAILAALGPFARYNVVEVGPGTAAMQLALVLPEAGPSVREMIAALAAGGVESEGGYRPCHLRIAGEVVGQLDYTERVWRRVLLVPLGTPLRNPERLAVAVARLRS
jgi:perosamine synthetase